MNILGFSFKKISVERKGNSLEGVKINTKIDIQEIKEDRLDSLKIEDTILAVRFSYIVSYDPNFAQIEIVGNILLSIESKIGKEILKQWKNKKIPERFRVDLFNIILRKSNIKALELEDEMNLPLHLPLPRISLDEKENKQF